MAKDKNLIMSSTIQIRVPLHLRKKFNEVAQKNKHTPAKLLRDFIHKYIAENSEDAE